MVAEMNREIEELKCEQPMLRSSKFGVVEQSTDNNEAVVQAAGQLVQQLQNLMDRSAEDVSYVTIDTKKVDYKS